MIHTSEKPTEKPNSMSAGREPYEWMDGSVWNEVSCYFTKPESLGYVLDSSLPTAGAIISGFYLGAALIDLANEDVGCKVVDDDEKDEKCDKLLLGLFQPDNIYIVVSFFATILGAITMPLFGSIVDHTAYRKEVGVITIVVLAVAAFLQIMISADTYLIVAFLQIIALYSGLTHALVYSAYLPEITRDQEDLVRHRTGGAFMMFGGELSFMAVMLAVLTLADDDNVTAARIAVGIGGAYFLLVAFLVYSRLLRGRPASRSIPEGSTALTAGAKKLYRTICDISVTHPYLLRYLIAITLLDGTMSVYAVIAPSYLQVQLGMDGVQRNLMLGTLLVVSFLFCPLAIVLSKKIAAKYGDVYGGMPLLVGACVYMGITTAIGALVMAGPDQQELSYIFAVVWGIGMAFYYSIEKGVYYFITPKGQSAEFSGIAMFAGKILSWMPLLSFLAFTESLGSMQYGLAFMAVFLLIGSAILMTINVAEARRHALADVPEKSPSDPKVIAAADDSSERKGMELPLVNNLDS